MKNLFIKFPAIFCLVISFSCQKLETSEDFYNYFIEAQKGKEADEKIVLLKNFEKKIGKQKMDSLLLKLLSERKELALFYVAGYYTRKNKKESLYPNLYAGCEYHKSLPDSAKWSVGKPFMPKRYSKNSFIKYYNPCE